MPGNWRPSLFYIPFPGWLIFLLIVPLFLIVTLWSGLASNGRSFTFRLALVFGVILVPAIWLSLSLADPWGVMGIAGGLLLCIFLVAVMIYLFRTAE